MTSIDVLNLERISRNISNLTVRACRLDEARRKLRDAVKGDFGNGGDDWVALRKVAAELMTECDRAIHNDLEQAAIDLKGLTDGIGYSTK